MSKATKILLLIVVTAAACGVVIWLFFIRPNNQEVVDGVTSEPLPIESNGVCTSDQGIQLLETAAQSIGVNQNKETLAELDGRIRALEGWDQDIDCLYVVLQKDIASGDADSAATHLSQLKQLKDGREYSDIIRGQAQEISQIEEQIKFMGSNFFAEGL